MENVAKMNQDWEFLSGLGDVPIPRIVTEARLMQCFDGPSQVNLTPEGS